jgi:RimJ/RimL family protein N-acetyltransferase
MPSQNARPRKKVLWFQCGRYFARTIKREDASERWASWLSDSWTAHVLNTPAVELQKSDIIQYIKKFDQRSRLLLGIFERGTRVHVGIIRLDIDYAASEAIVNAIIGEPEHRNRGATVAIFVPTLDYLFDTVGLHKVTASTLLRNQVTIRFLLKLGWQMDEVRKQVRSKSDGTMLDMCSISYTRDAYRAYRETKVGKRILQRLNQDRVPGAGDLNAAASTD